jgi:cell division protease FtsH
VHKRPTRGSYTGYGKRLPSDRPPVLTPKELALIAASDSKELPPTGNGQSSGDGQDYGRPFGSPPPEPGDPGIGGTL